MKTRFAISLMVLGAVLTWAACLFVAPVALATHTVMDSSRMPNGDQSLARMLWGSLGTDNWSHTSTGKDSLSYKFIFVNPDSTDTLDVAPSGGWFTSDVQCTVLTYGDSSLWIDKKPMVIKAGESIAFGARVRWIHVGNSGAGLQRAQAWAD